MKNPNDIIHVYLKFEDTFSFAKTEKVITVPMAKFEHMKQSIGKVVIDRLNKATHIHETIRLVVCEQFNPSGHGEIVPVFYNEPAK